MTTQQPSRATLEAARMMNLLMMPASDAAHLFIDTLSDEIAGLGTRAHRRRSKAAQEAHRRAVGAVVGDLLTNWQRGLEESLRASKRHVGGLSYRPSGKGTFTGHAVSSRTFHDVLAALISAGYVEQVAPAWTEFLLVKGGGSFPPRRRAARIGPTKKLLEAARNAGVGLTAIGQHFITDPTAEVEPPAPVVLEGLKQRAGRRKIKTGELPMPDNSTARQIIAEVEDFNAFAAKHRVEVSGQPIRPVWQRKFNLDLDLHGRWYAPGDSYQTLSAEDRVGRLTIDGAPVAEVDVSASHMTCLYGLLKAPFDPDRDPYHLRDYKREVVKAWVTASLGKGQALSGRSWPAQAVENALTSKRSPMDLRECSLPPLSAAVLRRHPVMADLPGCFGYLAARYGVAKPQDVFGLFLMGVEARVMTAAMLDLKGRGVLALPVHDSLIVAREGVEAAKDALQSAFQGQLGVTPRLKVSGEGGVAKGSLTPADPEWWGTR